jgi:hypothetical protein
MIEIEKELGIANPHWLMSSREKLGLIGLLQCLNPKSVIELGYHRGGATKWLTQFSKKVLTVDVNEFITDAPSQYSNLEAWNCSTVEAIKKIKAERKSFDLAIVDADHSRLSVCKDIQGILPHAKVVLMHDSYNPGCRKGILDALKHQQTHAYLMDFIPATLKHDGLWGGLAIAWRSDKPGPIKEFNGELSSFNVLAFISLFRLKSKVKNLKISISEKFQGYLSKLKILFGRILRN